jgi:hypothetical protein
MSTENENKEMQKRNFELIITEDEKGLQISMNVLGFDPLAVIGLLELQKSVVLEDLRGKKQPSDEDGISDAQVINISENPTTQA